MGIMKRVKARVRDRAKTTQSGAAKKKVGWAGPAKAAAGKVKAAKRKGSFKSAAGGASRAVRKAVKRKKGLSGLKAATGARKAVKKSAVKRGRSGYK